jgi:hypothetical protein
VLFLGGRPEAEGGAVPVLRGWTKKEVLQPRGAWTQNALRYRNNPSRGSIAQNVRFYPPYVYSREGLTPVGATTAGKVTGTYNWISPTDNFLVYQDGTSVIRMRVADNTTFTLATGLGGRSVSISELGPRLYFTEFNNDGSGASIPQVHDGVTATDNCFRGPLVFTSFTVTDPATTAGACTVGVHFFGFLFTSRSGYTGLPGPSNTGLAGGTFVPATFTVTAGANHGTLTVSVTLNTPTDAGPNSNLELLMTRSDNPNIYYIVPPPFVTYSPALPLPASTNGYTFTVTVSISDEDLANQTPALPFFDAATTAPYSPNVWEWDQGVCK